MTMKTHKAETPDSPLASLFEMTDSIWLPHRSAAKAFLAAQDNAFTYLAACRTMMDEMRGTMRKEQDFALEASRKACKDVAEKGWAALSDPSAMSAAIAHAMSGARAFGAAWTKAQQHSFSAMPTRAYDGLQSNVKKWSDIVKAAGSAGDTGSRHRTASPRTASHH
jgi:hypothetical protein